MDYVEKEIFPKIIVAQNIQGAIIEFGVAQGGWLEKLYTINELYSPDREVIGFDSFEGLPETDRDNDYPAWRKGMYKADYETVAHNLKITERKNLKLIKGWFCDTFTSDAVKNIDKIAYARIDCDIYQSSFECFKFIDTRLSEGAVVVCDDWGWSLGSETKAFYDWLPHSRWNFEFLFYIDLFHIYFRVKKK
jgi:hypothetical protein